MKIRILIFTLLLAVLGFGAVLVGKAQGNEARQEDSRKVVAFGKVIEGDYVAAGETVEISGTVKGDVYAFGGQVLVNGVIEGDLLALGGSVSVSGRVDQNVRIAAWQTIISGIVGRNITAGAMNIEVTRGAQIQGTMLAGAVNIVLNGPIGKTVKVAGKNLTVAHSIHGDLEAAVETTRLASGSEIQGDFTYWSNREVSIAENVFIEGEITKKAAQGPVASVQALVQPVSKFIRPFFGLVSFLSSLILGVLVIRLLPDFTKQTVSTLQTRKWRSLTSGATALLILPIVFGILIITIVGIPLGFVLLIVSSLLLYVARIFVMLWVGMWLAAKMQKNITDIWALGVGLVVYSIVVQLPIIGWAASFLVVLFGLGAAVQTFKEKYFANKNSSGTIKGA